MKEIKDLSMTELRRIAKQFSLTTSRKKEELIHVIEQHYYNLQRFISYRYVRQLGHEGKDGRTFLAINKDGKEVAIKIFKPTKSTRQIEREATLQQQVAEYSLAPSVIEFNGKGKYIVMEKLDTNLYDLFCRQQGQLTNKQQKDLLQLFRALDTTGVFHADPNPLNFMYKGSRLYVIDFGMAKKMPKDLGKQPNLKYMTQGLVLKLREIHPSTTLSLLSEHCFI